MNTTVSEQNYYETLFLFNLFNAELLEKMLQYTCKSDFHDLDK